jgi:hypothetical protein
VKSAKAEDNQMDMLKAWCRELIAKSEAIEMTNCDNFMTVHMPAQPARAA